MIPGPHVRRLVSQVAGIIGTVGASVPEFPGSVATTVQGQEFIAVAAAPQIVAVA